MVADMVLPPVCVNCRHPNESICTNCLDAFVENSTLICQHCGRPQRHSHADEMICSRCQHSPPPLIEIRTPFVYAEPLSNCIKSLKYQSQFGLAVTLAQEMAKRMPAWQKPIDTLVPLPLHPKRKKERGFNQATLLAKQLSYFTNISFHDNLITRVRNTPPQARLNLQERQHNMQGAFIADDQAKDKHILLIDDVYTTGATLSAAAEALQIAGAKSVSGYCLACAIA